MKLTNCRLCPVVSLNFSNPRAYLMLSEVGHIQASSSRIFAMHPIDKTVDNYHCGLHESRSRGGALCVELFKTNEKWREVGVAGDITHWCRGWGKEQGRAHSPHCSRQGRLGECSLNREKK